MPRRDGLCGRDGREDRGERGDVDDAAAAANGKVEAARRVTDDTVPTTTDTQLTYVGIIHFPVFLTATPATDGNERDTV